MLSVAVVFSRLLMCLQASQVALVRKKLPANAGTAGDAGSIPGSGRSPGGGQGNPLQHSCLENPMNRGAWWARVHRVAKVRHNLATKQQTYDLCTEFNV